MAGHVLGQGEDFEVLGYGCLDNIFQRILRVAWAESARVAVMRIWHVEVERKICYTTFVCFQGTINVSISLQRSCMEDYLSIIKIMSSCFWQMTREIRLIAARN